ncbi:MAG: hypothetical protein QM705_03870 [Ancrocorticia sp.]
MATAPAADQLTLLDVADLDSQIARLERSNVKHPLREKLGTIMNAAAARARDKEAAEKAVEQAEAHLAECEAKSAVLQKQIAEKDAKLNAGTGLTSRDLLVLQQEIEGLREMLNVASDVEFEALEGVEAAQDKVAALGATIGLLKDDMLAKRAALEDAVAQIQAEQQALRAQRDALYEPLAEDLKRIYQHSRESGGYAVMALNPNGTTSAGINLSPVEVSQIRALPEDEIYLSEDYDAIVVRLPS